MDFASALLQAFVTFFVIMDPFASMPVFCSMTRGQNSQKQFASAKTAVFIAAAALLAFILVGRLLFSLLGLSVQHFQIAGGLILFLIALEYVLGISFPRDKRKVNLGVVIIGVPLITGPGVLTASILLVNAFGFWITIIAAALALLLTFLILLYSQKLMSLLGETGSEIFSRIMGLLLASMAVEFVLSGLAGLKV